VSRPAVSLHEATPADATLLANLLELYIHDLSAAFPAVALGPDGRFGYPSLPRYWSEPERRFAFLIRADEQTAGFVLATRGSPAVEDPDVLDVAEFFVLRRFRGAGVGRRAAALLWQRVPGRWVVRVSEANPDGLAFWRRVVEAASPGGVETFTRPGSPAAWQVFTFRPAPPRDAG
jgi:predicted acetyltransferase